MDYKRLIIRGISYSQSQSGAYALLLEDEETNVKLPIVIGNFEAQSISLGLEKDLNPPRPLTHDLFAKFVISTNYKIESVIIYQIVFFINDGTFDIAINKDGFLIVFGFMMSAYFLTGIQSIIYSLLMEFLINPKIKNNFAVVILSSALGGLSGIILLKPGLVVGALTGMLTGIILRRMYLRSKV